MADPGCAFHHSDHELPASAATLRDLFLLHAPPMPAPCMDAYLEHLRINDNDLFYPEWNDWLLNKIARQECRWREIFADAMLAARNQSEARTPEERTPQGDGTPEQ